jgi:hypothetical protein
MFIIYIIYKFEFSTSLLFTIYYLVFSMHNDEVSNLHGLNCYCWDFIINIYIFFIILEPGTPMLGTPRPPSPMNFPKIWGCSHTSPLCVSPLPRTPVPESWWNIGPLKDRPIALTPRSTASLAQGSNCKLLQLRTLATN